MGIEQRIDLSWLPQPLPTEFEDLSRRLGPPQIGHVASDDWPYLRRVVAGRSAEVCMVVRRPSGRLLTFRKPFYPAHVYRLMTGGIERGEGIMMALLREVREETGLDVQVARFLAASTYATDGRPRFASFAFLLDERGGTLGALDPDERVEAFREIEVDDLLGIAQQLEDLGDEYNGDLNCTARDWGRLRWLNHRLVHQALRSV